MPHALVNVDVQFVSADEVLIAQSTADGEGQPGGHLAPYQRHLGTQAELACSSSSSSARCHCLKQVQLCKSLLG
jgi:hypothetical protein